MTQHVSLRRTFNLGLVLLWAALLTFALVSADARPWPFALAGVAGGIAGGLLQRHALRVAHERFAQAKTALEVRAAFRSTRSGRSYFVLFWLFNIAFVFVPLLRAVESGPAALFAPLVAYASFNLARELTTLPSAGKRD